MSAYTKIDSLIVQAVKHGKHPRYDNDVSAEAARLADALGRESFRVVDGRMTALKRIGHIAFNRSEAKWTTIF